MSMPLQTNERRERETFPPSFSIFFLALCTWVCMREGGEHVFYVYKYNVGMRLNEIVPGAISVFSFRKYVFFSGVGQMSTLTVIVSSSERREFWREREI